MDNLKNALINLDISDASVIKFIKGFPIERSRDKSKLFIYSSNKAEQKTLLSFVALLDKHIQIENPENYETSYRLEIPYARELIEKLEKHFCPVTIDSSELLNTIQECVERGAKIELLSPDPGEYRTRLFLYSFKSANDVQKLKTALLKAGITVGPMKSLPSNNDTTPCEIFPGSQAFNLYSELALRIAELLDNRKIDFQNKISTSAIGRGI